MRNLLRRLASIRFPWLLLASSPAFAADGSTLETAATHFEKNTNNYLILLAAVGPILALVGAALFVVRYVMPAWQSEQKATRDQREIENEKTRLHVKAEMDSTRALADSQNQRIVADVSGKVDRLHEDVRSISRRTGEIATKLGLPLALIVAVSLASAAWLLHANTDALAGREKCDKACPTGRYCCGKNASGADSDGCCASKTGTASSGDKNAAVLQPHSQLLMFATSTPYVLDSINNRVEVSP